MSRDLFWMTALVAALAFGCEDGGSSPDPQAPATTAPDPGPVEVQIAPSKTARVKFKGGERFVRDLAAGLELERSKACRELSLYDCVSDAHNIALGGVDPYELRINDPLPILPVTSAIAADRVALGTCNQRVKDDFDDPEAAVVFGALVGESGPPDAQTLDAVSAELYSRILRRDATEIELRALADLHAEVMTETGDDGRRMWAQLACFAVATTMESLFY